MGDETWYGELIRAPYDFFELRLWRRPDPRALYAVELPQREAALLRGGA
ncbi:MAG: hypothetical protein ACOC8F_01365 [Planctomycetota bacterium]